MNHKSLNDVKTVRVPIIKLKIKDYANTSTSGRVTGNI